MKTKETKLILLCGLLLIMQSLIYGAVEPTPYIYYIKLGEFAQYEDAEARLATLQQLNMQPLRLLQVNTHWEIHFGEFSYYMDAYLYQQDLKNLGYTEAEIIKFENFERKTSFPLVKGPRERVFKIKETADTLTTCSVNMEDPDVVYINTLLNSASTEEIHLALLQKIPTRQDTDPVKGWLSMRMAYIKIRMNDRALSQQLFQQVAEGKIMAPPEMRVEAMIRIAHLIHAQKDRLRDYRAYKEIYEWAQTEEQRAGALLELCGLMMELARSDKGTLAECRSFYEKALQEIPTNFFFTRATIELMHLESWYYEENYQKCIEEGEAYLKKYTEKPLREIATCQLFVGMAYYKTDRYAEAVATLSAVLDLPLGPKDRWKDIPDLKQRALGWLIYIAEQTGNKQDAAHGRELMNALYPQQ